MRVRIRIATLLSLAIAAGAAHAANLVENPDFADGLTGWSNLGNGTIAIDTDEGIPDGASIRVTNSGALSSCIVIDDSTPIDLHVYMKGVGGGGGLGWAGLITYSDATCTTPSGGPTTEAYRLGANDAWWRFGLDNVTLPQGTASAQVFLGAQMGTFGAIGDALFDHVLFGPTGTLGDAIPASQEGLTGTWYNPDTSGQGFEFVIDSGTNGGDASLFGAWFTYGTVAGGSDTQRWYSLQATFSPDATDAGVTIYQNIGGNFDAPPTTSPVGVGSGSLTFFSCDSARFSYVFTNGSTGAITLRRLLPNVECIEPAAPPPPQPSEVGLSGAWYDPGTSGQGILAEVNDIDQQVFVGWYTYSLSHAGAGDASDQRWLSAQGSYEAGSDQMDLTLYASTNGTFDSNATVVTTEPVGLATLTFLTCSTATLDYAFTDGEFAGQVDSIDLVRLGPSLASCPLDP